jgi:integrase
MRPTKVTLIHNRRNDGKGVLELKIYFPDVKKQIYITTGYSISSEFFDKDIQLISPDVKDYKHLNISTKLMIQKVKETLNYLEAELGRSATPGEFNQQYKSYKDKVADDTEKDFLQFFTEQTDKATELSESTIKSYRRTLGLLKQYRASIPFNALTYEFATDFNRWLRKKYSNMNTVRKHNLILRKFVAIASRLSLVSFSDYNSFMLFKATGQEVHKDYLLPAEIKLIETLNLRHNTKLYDTREMFMLAYYTSLRVSDIVRLTKDHFYKEGNQLHLKKVVYKLRKYNKKIDINLNTIFNGKGVNLIKPYLAQENDLVFPKYSTSTLYNNIKKIVTLAGITKTVSFHTARHSSLTIIASLTGDVFAVMLHGGLNNMDTAQKYIHLSEELFGSKLDGLKYD